MKQNPINGSAKVQLFLDSAKFFLFFCANGYIFIVFVLFGVQHITFAAAAFQSVECLCVATMPGTQFGTEQSSHCHITLHQTNTDIVKKVHTVIVFVNSGLQKYYIFATYPSRHDTKKAFRFGECFLSSLRIGRRLFSQAQLFNDSTITFDVAFFQIIEQTATFTNQHSQRTFRTMIFVI